MDTSLGVQNSIQGPQRYTPPRCGLMQMAEALPRLRQVAFGMSTM
jgi:hypothetical protein